MVLALLSYLKELRCFQNRSLNVFPLFPSELTPFLVIFSCKLYKIFNKFSIEFCENSLTNFSKLQNARITELKNEIHATPSRAPPFPITAIRNNTIIVKITKFQQKTQLSENGATNPAGTVMKHLKS